MALNFEKRHADTIRTIESLIEQMNSTQNCVQYFIPDEYRDPSGKLNKQYLLTRDGFTLLVMGFTGAKALQWKLKYIEAFNSMEKALTTGKFSIDQSGLQCIKETNKTLKFIQDKNLRDSVARQVLSKLYDIEILPVELKASMTITIDETVINFINSQCERTDTALVKINALHECYLSWCRLNKVKSLSKINFGRHMKLLGFEQEQRHIGRLWKGIKVKN